jgi:hypothetical protein
MAHVTCPVCNRPNVYVRLDGQLGMHWTSDRKDYRRRCPGGLMRQRRASGRRVTVTVDLVLPPADWDMRRAKTAIVAAIRDHCPDLFPVNIDVEESA